MPAKTPIYLKQNTGKNGNVGGKGTKKLREILSSDMISPPLGDFRHMAHVGRGGKEDMFGDTTFLQQKVAPVSNGNSANHQSSGIPNFHSFRKKGTGKQSKKERNSSVPDDSEGSPIFNQTQNGYGPQQSPILQTAVSLPMLNKPDSSGPSTPVHNEKDNVGTTDKKAMNNNTISVNEEHAAVTTTPETHLNGPKKPRRITDNENIISNGHVEKSQTSNGVITATKEKGSNFSDTTSVDEGWSLELDLGTSLMDDVMGIMDKIEL